MVAHRITTTPVLKYLYHQITMAGSLLIAIFKNTSMLYTKRSIPTNVGGGSVSQHNDYDYILSGYSDSKYTSTTLRKRQPSKSVYFNEVVSVKIVKRIYTSDRIKRRSFYTKQELIKFRAYVKQD